MNGSNALPQHTIRDDTASRHRHKYSNPNPLQRFTLGRFFSHLTSLLQSYNAKNCLEFGCGEGYLLRELTKRGFNCQQLIGLDLRNDALQEARRLHPQWVFECADLLTWQPPIEKFDIVLASQVLEHIPDPAPIMKRLVSLTGKRLVLTVPCEPWFQLLNLARGRDLARLGNHPEHVNRWSKTSFVKFVAQFATIESAEIIFPFTVVVARPLP